MLIVSLAEREWRISAPGTDWTHMAQGLGLRVSGPLYSKGLVPFKRVLSFRAQ